MERTQIGWTAADWYSRHTELMEQENHELPKPWLQILKENPRLRHGSRKVLDAANKLENDLAVVKLIESSTAPDAIKLIMVKKCMHKPLVEAEIIVSTIEATAKQSQKLHVATWTKPVKPTYQSLPPDQKLIESFNRLAKR